jgi:hypothetical protein
MRVYYGVLTLHHARRVSSADRPVGGAAGVPHQPEFIFDRALQGDAGYIFHALRDAFEVWRFGMLCFPW